MAGDDPLRPLLEAALEGDDRALARLVRDTQVPVWRLCRALGSPGEEEDLVQEVYLRALRAMPAYRGDAPVLPWLLSIGRRVCADHVRGRERRRRLAERVRATTTEAVTPGPPTPVGDLLEGLDRARREAFVLTQLLGLSYEDAAVVAGCPVGTIRSRVSRARAEMMAAVLDADTA